jgi:hypothetical protein
VVELKVKPRQENPVADMVRDKVQLNIGLDPEMRRALKVRAATEGRTVQQLVVDLIRAYLAS